MCISSKKFRVFIIIYISMLTLFAYQQLCFYALLIVNKFKIYNILLRNLNFNMSVTVNEQGDCKYTFVKDCNRDSKFQLKIINHPYQANSVLPFMRSLVLKLYLDTYKIKVL